MGLPCRGARRWLGVLAAVVAVCDGGSSRRRGDAASSKPAQARRGGPAAQFGRRRRPDAPARAARSSCKRGASEPLAPRAPEARRGRARRREHLLAARRPRGSRPRARRRSPPARARAVPPRRAAGRARARDRGDRARRSTTASSPRACASPARRQLAQAQARLEHALAAVERRYPATPAGLGVTVAWGLPYFRRLVPKLADGRRYPAYLPVDRGASKARGERTPAVLDAMPVRERRRRRRARRRRRRVPLPQRLARAHRRRASTRSSARSATSSRCTSVRNGFVGGGFTDGPGPREADGARRGHPRRRPDRRRRADVPRLHLDAEGGDGTRPDRELRDACAGSPTRSRGSFWSGGAAMHLSHLNEDLERWWKRGAVHDQLRGDDAPGPDGPRQDLHDRRGRDARRARRRRARGPRAVRRRRPQRDAADRDATAGATRATRTASLRPRGTAIVQRADFNTLDNRSRRAQSRRRLRPTPAAGVHFVAFAPDNRPVQPRAPRDGRFTRRRFDARARSARTGAGLQLVRPRDSSPELPRAAAGADARSRSSRSAQARVILSVPLQDRSSWQWSAVR